MRKMQRVHPFRKCLLVACQPVRLERPIDEMQVSVKIRGGLEVPTEHNFYEIVLHLSSFGRAILFCRAFRKSGELFPINLVRTKVAGGGASERVSELRQ